MVPLVLLPFACLVFITTATCMYEMVHWDVPLKQRLNLMALYGPYTALRKFWFLLGAFHLLGGDEANWFAKPGFSGLICSSASKAWSKALPQYLGLRGRKTSEMFYGFSICLVKRGPRTRISRMARFTTGNVLFSLSSDMPFSFPTLLFDSIF